VEQRKGVEEGLHQSKIRVLQDVLDSGERQFCKKLRRDRQGEKEGWDSWGIMISRQNNTREKESRKEIKPIPIRARQKERTVGLRKVEHERNTRQKKV